MKELSIEDKVKRYDEAIERAKSKIKNDKDHVLYEYDILDIFPELKESEDERIRKDVYNYLYNERHNIRQLTPYTDELDRWLAWLEKQKPINISIEDKRIRKSLINYVKAHGNGGDFTKEKYIDWLEKQGDNTYSWKPTEEQYEALDYAYNSCSDTERGNYYEGVLETLIDDLHKLSEKQGEQKETLCDKCKKAQPSHSCQDITALGRCYIEGMNASNKVEPKFKVGNWIVFNGLTLYVKEVVKGFYRTVSKGGIPNSYDWAIDNTAGLWTIQDAMDGDVIQLGEVTAIFKDFIGNGHCKCYCSVCNGEFEIPSQEGDDSYGCYNAAPATKEQRELLFTKMKEEGYEWDAENKELKKENLSDFESALFTAFSDAWQQYLLGEKVNVTQWVKEHSSELIEIAKQNDKTIA